MVQRDEVPSRGQVVAALDLSSSPLISIGGFFFSSGELPASATNATPQSHGAEEEHFEAFPTVLYLIVELPERGLVAAALSSRSG